MSRLETQEVAHEATMIICQELKEAIPLERPRCTWRLEETGPSLLGGGRVKIEREGQDGKQFCVLCWVAASLHLQV